MNSLTRIEPMSVVPYQSAPHNFENLANITLKIVQTQHTLQKSIEYVGGGLLGLYQKAVEQLQILCGNTVAIPSVGNIILCQQGNVTQYTRCLDGIIQLTSAELSAVQKNVDRLIAEHAKAVSKTRDFHKIQSYDSSLQNNDGTYNLFAIQKMRATSQLASTRGLGIVQNKSQQQVIERLLSFEVLLRESLYVTTALHIQSQSYKTLIDCTLRPYVLLGTHATKAIEFSNALSSMNALANNIHNQTAQAIVKLSRAFLTSQSGET